MVPFWIHITIRHLISRVPKKGHHPCIYIYICTPYYDVQVSIFFSIVPISPKTNGGCWRKGEECKLGKSDFYLAGGSEIPVP